ncbi:N-acetylneuraminate lyase [Halotydeus destructor]|nr:N-acetylneuraminate lyase [Halotydeus destructor]
MSTLQEKKAKLLAFTGPVVAAATPLDDNGELALGHLNGYIKHLWDIGVKGVYLHGSTGEGLSLSLAEKKLLTAAWIKGIREVEADMLVIVNASATCMGETKELVNLCSTLPVDGIAVLPPFYYRPENVDSLVKYLRDVSSFAPNLPLCYYHFPAMTGIVFPLCQLLRKCQTLVPALAALKYTSPDIIELQRIQTAFGATVKFFVGYEETMLPAFACGLDSAVCALFNFETIVNKYYVILASVKEDPAAARVAQRSISAFNAKFDDGSFIGKVKLELNETANGRFSVGAPRPPIYPSY